MESLPFSLILLFSLLVTPLLVFSSDIQDPELVVQDVHRYLHVNFAYIVLLNCKCTLFAKCTSHIFFFFYVLYVEASMPLGGTLLISRVELEIPSMTAGGVTPTGKTTARG